MLDFTPYLLCEKFNQKLQTNKTFHSNWQTAASQTLETKVCIVEYNDNNIHREDWYYVVFFLNKKKNKIKTKL